jgi:hypothetical protein
MVRVEVVGSPSGPAVSSSIIASVGGMIEDTWRHRVEAWVPIRDVVTLARRLPDGYFLEVATPPSLDDVAGEGPGAVNSDTYRDSGANGAGLTVAVIDLNFLNLTASQNSGDSPPADRVTRINCTPDPFEDPNGSMHGTGCLEAAYDHCPGATWRLYKIATVTDLGIAVDDAISCGANIITHSLSWFNSGWADDSGDVCAAISTAAEQDIHVFVSAGNYAEHHWQGDFFSSDGDQWHDWVTGDEGLTIAVAPGETVIFTLSWDTSGGIYDYDLHLRDSDGNNLASSENAGNNYEGIIWQNTDTDWVAVDLGVWRYSGGTTEMEVFTYGHMGGGAWQEYIIAESSTTTPSNTTHANVYSVGAVRWDDFDEPEGSSGIIGEYSSRGPSNSGMILPDICGPTDTQSFSYPTGFGGTSSATPNAAGAHAAFWSSDLLLSPRAIWWLEFEQAAGLKDWGSPGADNTYGVGGIQLITYIPHTLWVARAYGNVNNDRSEPYYDVIPAYLDAEVGGRLVFASGGSYPETFTMSKVLTLDAVGGGAHIGQ